MGAARPRVVTLGVHILDILGRPVDVIPAGQSSTRLEEIRITAAGTAAGTAVDLARLGAAVTTIGAIGDDEIGIMLRLLLERGGVDASRVVVVPDVQTSATILPIRSNGERPALHVVGANAVVGFADLDLTPIDMADAVHLGGLERMASLSDDDVRAIIARARAAGALVTMDFVSAPAHLEQRVLGWLDGIDVVLPNEEQAMALTRTHDALSAARALRDHGARAAVVTTGAAGSVHVGDDGEIVTPALDLVPVDTTGCGDAFCAAFVVARLRGLDTRETLRAATAAAALVAGGLGSDHGLESWEDLQRVVVSGTLPQA